MNAVGAAGERHVEPIVDDNTGRRPGGRAEGRSHQMEERSASHVAFADLDQIQASRGGRGCLPDDVAPATVGHKTDYRGSVLLSVKVWSACSRATNTNASSANPANRLTIPSPLTAPRM